ncbi:hybrid sensor histidine kinase/response regulator [Umboniibacter marinipuniceus]|uniref:histidine kinase n=1 Tax=Umboniibacter marinipuniceus TaxID=569599 RepID=A0A3M0AEL7_9GAMM|nr:response regulator [Umboniibacter marinipuniceus]RMA77632.1 PAS domain S-box-containing protein [Umboniibacter marinipuniceus]
MGRSSAYQQPDYEYLVENSNAIIVCFSTDGVITYANDFALRFFDFEAEALIGKQVLGTITPLEDSAGYNLEGMIHEISNLPEDYRININENIKRTGERVWVRWTNCVQTDDQGKVLGAMSIGIDVTRQLELERQVSQMRKLDALGTLAGGVAHDFNNIAQGMSGFAEMIKHEDDPDVVKHLADSIISAAADVGRLTNNLLSYSKVNHADLELCDVESSVQKAVQLVESNLKPGVSIEIRNHNGSDQIRLDRSGLVSATINLLLNANDATDPGGKIEVEIHKLVEAEPRILNNGVQLTANTYWIVDVRDWGVGVPADIAQKIFDPFFTTKVRNQGTGLGLASVFDFATAHRGSVELLRSEDETCFRLYLAESAEAQLSPSELSGQEDTVAIESGGIRHSAILLVDDEAFVRLYAEKVFAREGYQIRTAASCDEALTIVQHEGFEFDVAIIDMVMPEVTGVDTWLKLKALRPAAKAILATGYASEEQLKRAEAAGFSHCIKKPFKFEDVLTALAKS